MTLIFLVLLLAVCSSFCIQHDQIACIHFFIWKPERIDNTGRNGITPVSRMEHQEFADITCGLHFYHEPFITQLSFVPNRSDFRFHGLTLITLAIKLITTRIVPKIAKSQAMGCLSQIEGAYPKAAAPTVLHAT